MHVKLRKRSSEDERGRDGGRERERFDEGRGAVWVWCVMAHRRDKDMEK